MRCPRCKNRVVKQDGDTAVLRTKGPIRFTPQGAEGRCYWCSEPLTLPVTLTPSKPPSLILRR